MQDLQCAWSWRWMLNLPAAASPLAAASQPPHLAGAGKAAVVPCTQRRNIARQVWDLLGFVLVANRTNPERTLPREQRQAGWAAAGGGGTDGGGEPTAAVPWRPISRHPLAGRRPS